jgi:hypothetical protein
VAGTFKSGPGQPITREVRIMLYGCVATSLLFAGCSSQLDETKITRPADEPPSVVATGAEPCTSRTGGSRYAVCGSLSSAEMAPIGEGAQSIGSTSANLGTVSSENHTLGGRILAN